MCWTGIREVPDMPGPRGLMPDEGLVAAVFYHAIRAGDRAAFRDDRAEEDACGHTRIVEMALSLLE